MCAFEETTGQFVGLVDKNKKEIYEGDILLLPDTWTESILEAGDGPIEPANVLAEVIFVDKYGAFGCRVKLKGDCLREGDLTFEEIADCIGLEGIEVVGNIYENADLL
jgi:uncharacterized phage protein (TIGR01671 family)